VSSFSETTKRHLASFPRFLPSKRALSFQQKNVVVRLVSSPPPPPPISLDVHRSFPTAYRNRPRSLVASFNGLPLRGLPDFFLFSRTQSRWLFCPAFPSAPPAPRFSAQRKPRFFPLRLPPHPLPKTKRPPLVFLPPVPVPLAFFGQLPHPPSPTKNDKIRHFSFYPSSLIGRRKHFPSHFLPTEYSPPRSKKRSPLPLFPSSSPAPPPKAVAHIDQAALPLFKKGGMKKLLFPFLFLPLRTPFDCEKLGLLPSRGSIKRNILPFPPPYASYTSTYRIRPPFFSPRLAEDASPFPLVTPPPYLAKHSSTPLSLLDKTSTQGEELLLPSPAMGQGTILTRREQPTLTPLTFTPGPSKVRARVLPAKSPTRPPFSS